jgi:hypothetical protein
MQCIRVPGRRLHEGGEPYPFPPIMHAVFSRSPATTIIGKKENED